MGKLRGFIEIRRSKVDRRPIVERTADCRELEPSMDARQVSEQGARCMDCGIPFCHEACPLGNLIPEWNDLVSAGRFDEATASLHATNNFPEVTGRVCPAPCEASCVLNLDVDPTKLGEPVTIKAIERAIADRTLDEAGFVPQRPQSRSGRTVAIIGSGPAGLAAAQQLARMGHEVTVLEKEDRIGGLLRYGIPDFKLEKSLLDLRLAQLRAEGVAFRTSVHAGVDVHGDALRDAYDAIVLCGGAMQPRELAVEGRALSGVHPAMDFLTQHNRRVAGDAIDAREAILAKAKHVVVLGGGDTGSDCVGTCHRQGAESVTSLELMPRPPELRALDNPWPAWPLVMRTSSSHEEGGVRDFAVRTTRVLGDEHGAVRALEAVRVQLEGRTLRDVPESTFELPCTMLLLAMGFVGPVRAGLLEQLGVALDARGNVAVDKGERAGATSVPSVFAAGDMARGQSLVVWAIAEGRRVAVTVDAWLAEVSARRSTAAE